MQITAIVFDFDNAISLKEDGTGSEEVKDAAWPKVFGKDWESLKDTFPVFLKRWGGGKGSRLDIVRDALAHLRFEGDVEREVRRLCDDFNRIVQEGILAIGIAPKNRTFLERFSKRFPLFINSATPTEAMRQTLEKLGIGHFFKEVYGQEGGKAESIRRAMRFVGETDSARIIFVGDSPTDFEAAQAVSCEFIGVATKRNEWQNGLQQFPVIAGVYALEDMVKMWSRN